MFEELLERFDAAERTIDAYVSDLNTAIERQLPSIEADFLEVFIDEFVTAAMQIPEYGNPHAAPLIERLVENLSTPDGDGFVHINIQPNGDIFLFNEQFAGDYSDFMQANHFSKNENNPELRAIFWKYGIYMPDVEGKSPETTNPWMRKAMSKLPSYDDIIAERLDAWGDKAPYWYFIENGVASGSRGYPSFAGINKVKFLRNEAKRAAKEIIRGLIDQIEEEVVNATEQALREGRPVPKLADAIRREKVVTRGGNVFIQRRRGKGAGGGQFLPKVRGN